MKGYSRAGLLLVGTLVVLVATLISVQPVMSAENATDVTATVTVNSIVDVTLDKATITFGSLDPGTSDSAATNAPINVTIQANTNTDTNLSVNGSVNFTTGAYNFSIGNLTYCNETAGSYTAMTTSYAQGGYADWQDIPSPSTDTNSSIWTKISIPSGQVAGSYSATVSIKVGEGAP